MSGADFIRLLASAEHNSNHPIARGICRAADGILPTDSLEELAGRGIIAEIEGKMVAVGNEKLMQHVGAEITDEVESGAVYVGDGINDAPCLARADVGIAMGERGSDSAIESGDVVIMSDRLDRVVSAVKIARKTVGVAKQNIVFAIGVKALVLLLVSLNVVGMWAAVFADVGVAVLAILNSMRTRIGTSR